VDGGGSATAHLTVAIGTGAGALGDPTSIDYYADVLADGSSALVGDLPTGAKVVSVTGPDGSSLLMRSSGGFFVAWSGRNDAETATVTVTMADGSPVTLQQPTTVSGTFDPETFAAACTRQLTAPGSTYTGTTDPVFKIVHDTVYWIYAGDSTNAGPQLATCVFTSTATSRGVVLYSAAEPVGTTPVYGIRTWLTDTDGSGLVLGRVPADTTNVTVSRGGTVAQAMTHDGVFAAWLPAGTGTETVTAFTPSGNHTYTHPNTH
jgi:hypothetical protein